MFGVVPYGLAVRIPGFHPGGPGSTPGMGTFFVFCKIELHIVLDVGDSNTLVELQKNLADMAGLGDFFITQAPSKKPLTRKQFLEAQKYWPCQFHEDKRCVEKIVLWRF